ncbi:MAG: histidinol-phosphate transaminase [Betaproteobacteria bacterium]|nr:histidinol-phosphate transaminase [Betaproteobacteria bacterium]
MNTKPNSSRPSDLAARVLRLLRPDVQGLHAYAVQPSAGLVKLDIMENPFGLPPVLQQALGERLGRVALNRYPAERIEDLKRALALHARLPEGCELMLGNGSDELISLLTLALDVPGNVVIAPVPGFVMYEMSAKLQGVRFVGVPTTADFDLDLPAMLAAIEQHQPALIWLAYPNNPTANLWDASAVERVIESAPGLVVMDEAYQPFAERDSMAWMQHYEHVLVMRTMSKFGLAGVRIGYLMGRAALVRELDKLRPPFNVSVLNAEAALFALEHAHEYEQQAGLIRSERTRVLRALTQQTGVRVFDSQANMVLLRLPEGCDPARVFSGIKARKVLVKNVSGLHPLLAGCLRVTIGTPEENTLLLAAFEAALQESRP